MRPSASGRRVSGELRVRVWHRCFSILLGVVLGGVLAGVGAVAAETCTSDNLLLRAPVSGEGVIGEPGLVTDGQLYADGTPPNAPIAVQFRNTGSELIVDAGRTIDASGFLIQAAGSGSYELDGSLDGWDWQRPSGTCPTAEAAGHADPHAPCATRPATFRYLRIRGGRGSRRVSVSELRASCAASERDRAEEGTAERPVAGAAGASADAADTGLDEATRRRRRVRCCSAGRSCCAARDGRRSIASCASAC